ncbi:MAG TPA: hypothetical protein VMP11_19485 [Verrucomicrobiae bacterium]|nr:hypothetical protein [Verrucomicrobiae bacterium]
MKRTSILAIIAVAALAFATRPARADVANGSYAATFTGSAPVWDISGDYSTDVGLGFDMNFSITEDSSGNFTGSGTFDYDDGLGDTFDGDIDLSGLVKDSGSTATVSMKLDLSGSGTVVDDSGNTNDVDLDVSVSFDFAIDATDGQLVVTSGSASATETDLATGKRQHRSGPLSSGDTMDLPGTSTGDWTLTLNLTPNGTRYSGTATIQTSTGQTAQFAATGTYQSKTDTSKVTLKGGSGDLNLVVSTSGSSLTIHSAKGKLFGQKVNVKGQ